MSLRRTAVLIICVTFSGLFAVLYAISQGNIQTSFNYLEQEEVEEELTRAQKALEGDRSPASKARVKHCKPSRPFSAQSHRPNRARVADMATREIGSSSTISMFMVPSLTRRPKVK